jgi:predicted ribosomally synthesized peptide with nif11-like leader
LKGEAAMSIESVQLFIERMKTDEDFAKEITACKDAGKRMEFAQQAGYIFTPEELRRTQGKLSDEEISLVSGGWFFPSCSDINCTGDSPW